MIWWAARVFVAKSRSSTIKASPDYTRDISEEIFSIVIPVYQEVFENFCQAFDSWQKEKINEIILVIDHTATDCIAETKSRSKSDQRIRYIITKKPGKRSALVDGIKMCSGDIIGLVDADVCLDDGCSSEIRNAMSHSHIHALTTKQYAINAHSIAEKVLDIFWSLRYNEELPILCWLGNCVNTLSGRAAFFKRKVLIDIYEGLLTEEFLGLPVVSGDDKYLTDAINSKNGITLLQSSARVSTFAFSSFNQLIKQKVRWGRNSWRSQIKSIISGWAFQRPILAFYNLNSMLSPFLSLVVPINLIIAFKLEYYLLAFSFIVWWLFSRWLRLYISLDFERRHLLKYFIHYGVIAFLFQLIKIYSFVTLNRHGWMTKKGTKNKLPLFHQFTEVLLFFISVCLSILIIYWLSPIRFYSHHNL